MVDGTTSANPPRVRRSIRRLAYWVLPVLALIGAWQIWDAYEAKRVAMELTRSFPEGIEEGSRWPPRTNDASAYYAAVNVAAVSAGSVAALTDASDPRFSSRQVLTRYRAMLFAGGQPASEDVSIVSRLSSHYELPLRLVSDASARPYIGGRDSVVQDSYRFSGVMAMRDAVAGQTLELIRLEEADTAVESLISRVKLLRAYDPTQRAMAEFIKGTYVEDLAVDVAIVLSRLLPADDSLGRLDEAFASAYDDDEIAQWIHAETRGTYATFKSIWSGRRVGVGTVILDRPVLRHLAFEGLQTSREAIAAARLPWPERLHALDRLEDRRSPVLSWFLPGRRRVTAWPVASLASGVSVRIAWGMAATRLVRVALGVERYLRSQGTLPGDLAAVNLPAGVNLDPFTGNPFRYIREEGGYTVYSLGPNFRDDGGRLTGDPAKGQAPERAAPLDIGVRVRLRPTL